MKFVVLAAATALAAGSAHAATVSYSDVVLSQSTNWSQTLMLNQFDSAFGMMTGVTLTLNGAVSGNALAESLDASPTTILLDLGAQIVATVTGGPSLSVTVNPVSNQTFNASAYDGTIDFGGTSGVTYNGIGGLDSDFSVLTSGLAGFIGNGMISIGLTGTGTSTASGAGNLITQFSTNAAAEATVTYTYTPPTSEVPLPAGLPLLLAGLGGLALVRRRKS